MRNHMCKEAAPWLVQSEAVCRLAQQRAHQCMLGMLLCCSVRLRLLPQLLTAWCTWAQLCPVFWSCLWDRQQQAEQRHALQGIYSAPYQAGRSPSPQGPRPYNAADLEQKFSTLRTNSPHGMPLPPVWDLDSSPACHDAIQVPSCCTSVAC